MAGDLRTNHVGDLSRKREQVRVPLVPSHSTKRRENALILWIGWQKLGASGRIYV